MHTILCELAHQQTNVLTLMHTLMMLTFTYILAYAHILTHADTHHSSMVCLWCTPCRTSLRPCQAPSDLVQTHVMSCLSSSPAAAALFSPIRPRQSLFFPGSQNKTDALGVPGMTWIRAWGSGMRQKWPLESIWAGNELPAPHSPPGVH